jgi:hypothetical protein
MQQNSTIRWNFVTIAQSVMPKRLFGGEPVWVVSYPKSGRTWHRLLIGAYICFRHNHDVRDALELKALSRRLGVPLVRYSHNGANFLDPWDGNDPRVADPTIWQNGRMVLLVRDVKDTLVSSYFHAHHREKTFAGPISAFVRNPATGAEKILIAMNKWHSNLALTKRHLVQTYESLHENASSKLKEVLEFAGFADVDDGAVEKAVNFGQADNLRELEKANFFDSERLGSYASANAAKVRSARIGDYANHLSAEDIAYIEAMEDRLGNPFKVWGKLPMAEPSVL